MEKKAQKTKKKLKKRVLFVGWKEDAIKFLESLSKLEKKTEEGVVKKNELD